MRGGDGHGDAKDAQGENRCQVPNAAPYVDTERYSQWAWLIRRVNDRIQCDRFCFSRLTRAMFLRSRDGVTPLGYIVFLIVECLVSSPLRKAVLAERVKSAAMTNTFSTGSAAARFLALVALILF